MAGEGKDPAEARERAIEERGERRASTVSALLDDFLARYVVKEAMLRSKDGIARTFDRLVKPAIGNASIYDLRR